MLQWNDLHPYSAVHVAQVPGSLNVERVRRIINATLEARGLAGLSVDRQQGTYTYRGGPADCEVRLLSNSPDVRSAIYAEMERQLNAPFPATGEFTPFRFFVASAGDSFFLGLAYFHVAADAESVVLLLKELAEACLGEALETASAPPNLYLDGRAHLLRDHLGVVGRRLWRLPRQMRNLRQSHRPPCSNPEDFSNRFSCHVLEPRTLEALVKAAKAWQVTVNDVLLALLLKSLAPLSPGRAQARKRRKLSVGCIVNLRRELGLDSQRTFGLFLGSFTVTHDVPEGISLRQLAGDVGQETLAIKRHKLYLGTPLELGFARLMLRFFPAGQRGRFYRKNYPLWGGITNMNLNSLWPQAEGGALRDYFRGVSTGPATPLVLSVTTTGKRANLGLSYRPAVFSPETVAGFIGHFMDQLQQFEGSA